MKGDGMDRNELRDRLLEQRKRLQDGRERSDGKDVEAQQQQEQTSELSTLDNHPADQGTETLERERALAVMEQIDTRIEEIDAALARLDDGRFGKCEICGRDIPPERLEARPEARFCVDHQEEVERGAHPTVER
jgi:RNA polymerase-binding transcription factor DksA